MRRLDCGMTVALAPASSRHRRDVAGDADKTVAGMRAREVPGAFAVDNELVVEKEAPKSTKT
jgi:hypothetical protein